MSRQKIFLKHFSRGFFLSIAVLFFSTQLNAAPVRFIVTGDSRGSFGGTATNAEILGEIAAATVEEGADFILFPGDLVWGYASMGSLETQLAEWKAVMQPVYDAGIGVYPCRGNHELGQDDNTGTAFNAAFSGTYALPQNGPEGEKGLTYSFSQENVFIVALDQYFEGAETHKVNQEWLDEQFEANTLPHVFVFGHEPAFQVASRDGLDLKPIERNNFWESIAAAGGRTYFHTHDHMYAHARIDDGNDDPDNDVHQFDVATITDSFYGPPTYSGDNEPYSPIDVFYEINNYGYVVVDVDGNDVTITWKHRTAPGVYEAGGDVFSYSVTQQCTGDKDCPEGSGCANDVCVEDNPPVIGDGPFLAAGGWPILSTKLTLSQNYDVLWTFDDDYSMCEGLCTNRARYRRLDGTQWFELQAETDATGKWYAYTELPVNNMRDGTYIFRTEIVDCARQITTSKYYYFKVAH